MGLLSGAIRPAVPAIYSEVGLLLFGELCFSSFHGVQRSLLASVFALLPAGSSGCCALGINVGVSQSLSLCGFVANLLASN